MILISAEEVHAACEWQALVEALDEAHRGPTPLTDRSELHETNAAGLRETYYNLPAWLPGQAMGTKISTVMPGNAAREDGQPVIQALYCLFDGGDGAPVAVMDGTALTYRKTAGDSALGARYLSREDSCRLVMAGAGAVAPYLVRAHAAVRPIRSVLVWNRTIEKADRLARDLRHEGIPAECAADLEQACRAADIVCCATASTAPLVRGDWLKPGAHLDLVGSFTPEMRECDDAAVARACLFVDSRWYAIDQPGDLADPIRRGLIRREDVQADLFDLAQGRHPGRRSAAEVTLFKNGGGGHLDLFTAVFVASRSAEEAAD